ncbi:ISL3 family transposase [Bacillus sp. T33-2]|uniref:ISL3 family transposase n=1 Tax=Bacillus sp. T33-2 TaxID=2054168 RepID=UPI000C777E8A|nr:ISL3 family transposase [Bacillus sp. T33-2]PLR89333.1 transposase [Bacillus sp. T33-2]
MMPFCTESKKKIQPSQRSAPFVGIDDFAFKKRKRYGTIFIDLLTGEILDFLPNRDKESVKNWLKRHSEIQLITRDRSQAYKSAAEEASPKIKQVGDRWHIFQHLFEAVKKTIKSIVPPKWKPHGQYPSAQKSGSSRPLPKRLQHLEKHEDNVWKRIQHAQRLRNEGKSITAIAKKLGISRNTVYTDLAATSKPSFKRTSVYNRYLPLIRNMIASGSKGDKIEAACRKAGFDGHRNTLNYMIADERRDIRNKKPNTLNLQQAIIQILWNKDVKNHKEAFKTLHPNLLEAFPSLMEINNFVQSFMHLFQEKQRPGLRKWLIEHQQSSFTHFQTFMNGIRGDIKAVYYAITLPWSNGKTEGTINKLKNIKRMMYGRAGLKVLLNRLRFSI